MTILKKLVKYHNFIHDININGYKCFKPEPLLCFTEMTVQSLLMLLKKLNIYSIINCTSDVSFSFCLLEIKNMFCFITFNCQLIQGVSDFANKVALHQTSIEIK